MIADHVMKREIFFKKCIEPVGISKVMAMRPKNSVQTFFVIFVALRLNSCNGDDQTWFLIASTFVRTL